MNKSAICALCVILCVLGLFPLRAQDYSTSALPGFTSVSGTILTNTNGNWVTYYPAHPDDINTIETQLFLLPSKGQGLMGAEFKMKGGDGGTAKYQDVFQTQFAKGGGASTIQFAYSNISGYYAYPFFVTYGKHGESTTQNQTLCAGGGGGSTAMGLLQSNESYLDLYAFSFFPTLIAAAAGGGGAYAAPYTLLNGLGGDNGQSAQPSSWVDKSIELTNFGSIECTTHTYAGGSVFYPFLEVSLETASCNSVIPALSSAFNYSTFPYGNLNSLIIGQGGGISCESIVPANVAPSGSIPFSLIPVSVYLGPGGSGGSGFLGGGAGGASVILDPSTAAYQPGVPYAGGGGQGVPEIVI